jgi:AcrR family transcriptional regulator
MATTERMYGGFTPQERRQRRREQLLDAGLTVFATKGWARSTVLDVCRQAGLSQRYFYEAFTGREELFEALLDRIGAEVAHLIRAIFDQAAGNPTERVRSVLAALVDHLLDDPRRARVTLVESLADERFRERRRRALASFAGLGQEQLGELPGAADARSLELTSTVLTGGIAELLIAAVTGDGDPPDRAVLVEHLTRMWLGAGTGA